MVTVEIIAVGNELLLGDVQDSNTHWLCQQITGLGGEVRRAVIVRDEVEAIAEEIRQALERKPDLLFIGGGMGPTADDLTLEAVAKALNRKLALHPQAFEMVRQKYEQLYQEGAVDHPDLTEPRKKMAIVPEGAKLLHNPVGAAPGVLLRLEPTMLVCLPGVPAELQGIFTTSLQPVLKELFGSGVFVMKDVIADTNDESAIAPALQRLSQRFPNIYIKSRAKRFGADLKMRITLSCRGDEKVQVERQLEEATEALRCLVKLIE